MDRSVDRESEFSNDIKAIEKEIEQVIEDDIEMLKNHKLLRSINCIRMIKCYSYDHMFSSF